MKKLSIVFAGAVIIILLILAFFFMQKKDAAPIGDDAVVPSATGTEETSEGDALEIEEPADPLDETNLYLDVLNELEAE